MERVLRYYEGYINKLCTRMLYDEYSYPYVCLDEWMKHHLENKLVSGHRRFRLTAIGPALHLDKESPQDNGGAI